MRFAAIRDNQNSLHKESSDDTDDDDDGLPKGLSSSLSSSRLPGEPAKKNETRKDECSVFVGTNRSLEKPYLRLTTFPKAEGVRPLAVLQKSLKHIKEQYLKDEDFAWANEQLKSVRQDITVQGLKVMFVLEVYETHARILLEHNDLNEFNQCQTMIRTLTTGLGGPTDDNTGDTYLPLDDRHKTTHLSQLDEQKDEFGGYRLLYSLVQNADLNKALMLTRLILKEKRQGSSSPKLSSCLHALQVIKAVVHNDYRHFFRLYDSAPHRSALLMDSLVKRVRDAAYERIVAAYRPSIGVEQIRTSLSFKELKETKRFLKQNGAVFIKEKGEPRFWVDCKASKKLL